MRHPKTLALAYVTLAVTMLLVTAGGVVHSSGSALACPDWPLCYESAMPEMTGMVFYEHGHRLLATLVATLTAIIGFVMLRRLGGAERRLGFVAYGLEYVKITMLVTAGVLASRHGAGPLVWALVAGALCISLFVVWVAARLYRRTGDGLPSIALGLCEVVQWQAALGGLTVLMRLPTAVSTIHLATSMIYLCGVVVLIFALRRVDGAAALGVDRKLMGIATAGVYVQMLFGALVRHTGSGLACGTDIITCNTAASAGAMHLLNTHKVLAVVVLGLVIYATLPILKAAKAQGAVGVRRLAVLAHFLVTAQVALGIATVLSFIAMPVATAHLVVGALLLLNCVALWLVCDPSPVRPAVPQAVVAVGVSG